MQSYENYDLQEKDPYLLNGSTCLINRLGITDTQALNEAEAAISEVAFAELIANPIEPTFNLEHLCRIHHYLFRDIYEWAGQLRQTEISKGGQLFLPYRNIEDVAAEVFYQLQKDSFLRELDETEFAYKAAYYLGRVNMIHPFREGNGRVQRIFLDQLAELSGYAFQWSGVSGERMAAACREARQQKPAYTKLERLLATSIIRL